MERVWQKTILSSLCIDELLIVIVVIAILASISVVAYTGIQGRARDSQRISMVNNISRALELYKIDNGSYLPIQDRGGWETSCGSQTENWGHCDRMKALADYLQPHPTFRPESLSTASTGDQFYYYYTSSPTNNFQTYGLMVYLNGNAGNCEGGYHANAYEIGDNPRYCMASYAGAGAN